MAKLAEIEDAITAALAEECKTIWGAKSVEYGRPYEFPGECDGEANLPKAFVVLVDQLPGKNDPEADRCGGWALLHYELHLRECTPKGSAKVPTSRVWLQMRTNRAAAMRRRILESGGLADTLGHVARWQGDQIAQQPHSSDQAEGEKTMRTACRFEFLVQAEDWLY